MNIFWIILIILIAVFSSFVFYCAIAINAPRTKAEFDYRFKQDCAEFDKYVEKNARKSSKKPMKDKFYVEVSQWLVRYIWSTIMPRTKPQWL